MNKFLGTGRLVADPDVRQVKDGLEVVDFRFANNFRKMGKEETLWLTCVAWVKDGRGVGQLVKHAKKGSFVSVSGTLVQEEYQDKEGNTRTKLKLELDDNGFNFEGGNGDKDKDTTAPAADVKTEKKAKSDDKPAPTKKNGKINLDDGSTIPF